MNLSQNEKLQRLETIDLNQDEASIRETNEKEPNWENTNDCFWEEKYKHKPFWEEKKEEIQIEYTSNNKKLLQRKARKESSFPPKKRSEDHGKKADIQKKKGKAGSDFRASWNAMYAKASSFLLIFIPTGSILGRACLFMAVHFSAICLFLIWFQPKKVTLAAMIRSIISCERGIRYCGLSSYYGWHGFEGITPTHCTEPLEPNTILFCDDDYYATHWVASFVYFQSISVVAWAIIWMLADHKYLNVKDPYGSARTTSPLSSTTTNNKDHGDADFCNGKNGEWRQLLSNYYSKRMVRSDIEKKRLLWRLFDSLALLFRSVITVFFVTSSWMWYWGHPDVDLFTKNIFPIVLQVLVQLGNDPNLISKSIFGLSRLIGSKDVMYNSASSQSRSTPETGNPPGTKKVNEKVNEWSDQVCMLIACHHSASSEFEATQLRRTLEAALLHFPPNHIFVCDNANCDVPPDDTQSLVEGVNPYINYLYIPAGNKSFAFYWTEKYWVPHLQRHGVLPKQASNYLLTVDDDVNLPKNFSVPIERLTEENDIASVQYQVVASDPALHEYEGKPLLVALQDIEYMGLSQIPERYCPPPKSAFSPGIFTWCAPIYCSGAISVWRGEDFRDVMSKHDSVFHGEDLQMGLLTIARRTSKRIVACDDRTIVIPTTVPSSFGDLVCQRVKSWELIVMAWGAPFLIPRFFQAAYHALCGHKTSMKSAPWFICKLMGVLTFHDPSLFAARLFVCIFLFPNFAMNKLTPILFGLVWLSLQYIGPFIYYAQSLEHIQYWRLPTMKEWLFWPVYTFASSYLVTLAYIYNLTAYGHAILPPSMESREALGDVPPFPRNPRPDWNTIWKLGVHV